MVRLIANSQKDLECQTGTPNPNLGYAVSNASARTAHAVAPIDRKTTPHNASTIAKTDCPNSSVGNQISCPHGMRYFPCTTKGTVAGWTVGMNRVRNRKDTMYKLFYSWHSLCWDNHTDDPSHLMGRIKGAISKMRAVIPRSGWMLLLSLIAVVLSSTVVVSFPECKALAGRLQFAMYFCTCISAFLFLRFARQTEIKKIANGEHDRHMEDVARLLLDNNVDDLRKLDTATAWVDELIGQKQVQLSRFTGVSTIALSFCIGMISSLLSEFPHFEARLTLMLGISMLLLGIAVIDIPTALFHLIDGVAPISLSSLQHFKGDLLGSRLAFIQLLQHCDATNLAIHADGTAVSGNDPTE